MQNFDTIIIGAGHNGLVCAAYLAQGGQRVLVVEAADTIGGLAATREFHPGFKVSAAHSMGHFSPKVIHDLKLADHGLKFHDPLRAVGLNGDGDHIVLQNGKARGLSPKDTLAFEIYLRQMTRFASVMDKTWLKTMPRIGNNTLSEILTFAGVGLKLRGLGKIDMGEFLRIASLPAHDLMNENFDHEILKAILSWEGLIGSKMAPRSPNSTVLNMLYRMSEGCGDHVLPIGGIEGLVSALVLSAEKAGAEIRTGTRVDKIIVEAGREGLGAKGVALNNGEQILADRVVSATDPKRTFFDLVGSRYLEIEFTNRIRRLRSEGLVAKLHLALDALPDFIGLDRPDGRLIIAPDMDVLEFAFDSAKYGESPDHPAMEILIPSLYQPSLAPNGKHVLSAHVMYVPYSLKGGWTEKAKDGLTRKIIDTISRYAPGIKNQIVHQELLTPLDIEQKFNVTGGHWNHGDFAMDQMLMMRPTYDAAQYSTPVPGLYLCSAGCHPGGDLTGVPGHNAAQEILK